MKNESPVSVMDWSAGKKSHSLSASASVAIGVISGEGGFVFDREYYFNPEHRWKQDVEIARWAEKKYAPYPIYNAEAHLVQVEHQPIPYRQVGGIQPNLILGAALGAEFVFFGKYDPDMTPYPLKGLKNLDSLRGIRWEEREPIKTFLRQVDELKKKYRGEVDVFPPFFWDRSGRATVHGPITTAHKLMGEDFYLAMFDDFEFASEFLHWIAKAYVDLIRLFSERAEMNVTSIHMGECSGCMISPEHWEAAVVPSMNIMADACGGARIHSCGNSDHILGPMSQVRHLGTLNIGTNTSVAKSREYVGTGVRIDVQPGPQELCFGKPGEIRQWTEKCIAENGDGQLAFEVHMDASVPEANIYAMFDALKERGVEIQAESLVERWGVGQAGGVEGA